MLVLVCQCVRVRDSPVARFAGASTVGIRHVNGGAAIEAGRTRLANCKSGTSFRPAAGGTIHHLTSKTGIACQLPALQRLWSVRVKLHLLPSSEPQPEP